MTRQGLRATRCRHRPARGAGLRTNILAAGIPYIGACRRAGRCPGDGQINGPDCGPDCGHTSGQTSGRAILAGRSGQGACRRRMPAQPNRPLPPLLVGAMGNFRARTRAGDGPGPKKMGGGLGYAFTLPRRNWPYRQRLALAWQSPDAVKHKLNDVRFRMKSPLSWDTLAALFIAPCWAPATITQIGDSDET